MCFVGICGSDTFCLCDSNVQVISLVIIIIIIITIFIERTNSSIKLESTTAFRKTRPSVPAAGPTGPQVGTEPSRWLTSPSVKSFVFSSIGSYKRSLKTPLLFMAALRSGETMC